MSLCRDIYLIYGFDISDCITDRYGDWRHTDEGSKYVDFAEKGNVQIIKDLINGDYIYFGYILACIGEDYSDVNEVIDMAQINLEEIKIKLRNLFKLNIVDVNKFNNPEPKLIMFAHYY